MERTSVKIPQSMNNEPNLPPDDIQEEANAAVGDASQAIDTFFEAVLDLSTQAGFTVQRLLEEATKGTGETLAAISNIPLIRWLSDRFGAGWLKALLGEVDVERVRDRVSTLKLQNPQATQGAIAQRLIADKATAAGQVGLVSNIIPPFAVALFGVELAAVTRLQAELVYEIAAAYDLDLNNPTRRGEAIAIFVLSLATDFLTLGLNFVEVLPGVGAVVGASSNATIMFALGLVARRFYEAKTNPEEAFVTPDVLREASQTYLKGAIAQQAIVEQILAHMVVASYPDKSWTDFQADLQAAGLSSATVKAISTHLEKRQPLDMLLVQLDRDFAPPLLARCQAIATSNGEMTPQAREILAAIAARFHLDKS